MAMNKRAYSFLSPLGSGSEFGGSFIESVVYDPGKIEVSGVDITDSSARAQCFRLLKELRKHAVDTISARRDLNIMMPSARVRELRKAGYLIKIERVGLDDDQGRRHHGVALYVLVGHAACEDFSVPVQYVLSFYE
jgi:hypothetical protein